ncbi:MAG TPA: carboxypeptidase-like regulatory domain-containing protein [Myxococcaceae bacterium]|jgi:hypothetical protein
MTLRPAIVSAVVMALAFGAGSCGRVIVGAPFCTTDAECGAGEICFPDGCGDPGQGLKMQVTTGKYSQEIELADPHAAQEVVLERQATFSGQLRQDTASGPVAFTGSVTFRGGGSALLVTGYPRRIDELVQPSAGQYSFPASSGKYLSLTASSADPTIPPVSVENQSLWTLAPGADQKLDVTFPAQGALVRISGTLVLSTVLGPVGSPMQIQVLELNTGRPLSQPAPVDPLTGTFSVLASPKASGQYVQLLASPRDAALSPDTIVPTRIFGSVLVTVPFTPITLQMGDFGSAVEVTGAVQDANGVPVAGAKVYTERATQDRNNYTSTPVFTGADGAFRVKALPTLTPGDGVSLWVVPPSGSHAGTLEVVATVPPSGGSIQQPLRCPRRPEIRGQVFRPSGSEPATGVNVVAEPVGGVPGRKPPTYPQESTTDTEGRFSFFADPGEYRLDFHSPDTLPRVSRRVIVDPPPGPDPTPTDVPPFTLWNGRKLNGSVSAFATPNAPTPTAVAGATVELFRVVTEGPKKVYYSLGRTTTESNGTYELSIPTVPEPPPEPDGG